MSNPNLPGPEEAVSQYNRGSVMGYSIRSDRYRYTEWRTTAANGGAVVGREIYDHFIDPNENTNIASVVTGNSGNIENLVVNKMKLASLFIIEKFSKKFKDFFEKEKKNYYKKNTIKNKTNIYKSYSIRFNSI